MGEDQSIGDAATEAVEADREAIGLSDKYASGETGAPNKAGGEVTRVTERAEPEPVAEAD